MRADKFITEAGSYLSESEKEILSKRATVYYYSQNMFRSQSTKVTETPEDGSFVYEDNDHIDFRY